MSLGRLFKPRKNIPFAEWGREVREFNLQTDGCIQYAQWMHPFETPKPMTQTEIDGLRQFVRPGDFAIDIGAHTGDTTVPMAVAAGKEGCVLALEPNPYVYKVLQENANLNPDCTNIEPRCFAATETDGSFVFHYSDASFCNGGFRTAQRWKLFGRKHPLTIEGRRLLPYLYDHFADRLPKLAYVKVDAEGYDRAILESIMPVITKHRPVIRTEVYRKLIKSERHALYGILSDNDYDVFRFQGGADPKGPSVDRDAMTAEKHFDLLAVPRSTAQRVAA